jgi:PPK2 family polyphosphate:nucleotide phosphotransferase
MKKHFPKISNLIRPYAVSRARGFRLKDFDPGDTQGLDLKADAEIYLDKNIQRLSDMQQKLYAQDCWSILLVFQAMDAAGKDSAIRHVMSGVNPQGCQVFSFKQPSAEDLSHDYLWRASKSLPERGRIGIFNRSYYEEVLVVRVRPQVLEKERIPRSLLTKRVWKERFEDINAFERTLTRNGMVIRKFYLNVSKQEQRSRFLKRLDEPEKNWKFSEADVHEREHWDRYMAAYDDMISHTATEHAPWYVVPADNKWFTHLVVSSVIVRALQELRLSYPQIDEARRKELNAARELLLSDSLH